MDIELRNVKYSGFASHETSCFEAAIYIDGKKVGSAENQGFGGPTSISLPPHLMQQLNEYAASLPVEKVPAGGGKFLDWQPNAETVIDRLLNDHLVARDLKRLLGKRILFTVAGSHNVYQTNTFKAAELAARLAAPEAVKVRVKGQPPEKILNLLPFAEALEIFKRTAA